MHVEKISLMLEPAGRPTPKLHDYLHAKKHMAPYISAINDPVAVPNHRQASEKSRNAKKQSNTFRLSIIIQEA
jgi:hypothetical protein